MEKLKTGVKERPILFTSVMIRALPNKSQTRRTRNLNFINKNPDRFSFKAFEIESSEGFARFYDIQEDKVLRIKSPYGIAGDRLWVRETWAIADDTYGSERFYYKADGHPSNVFDLEGFKWKPSIHMPRVVSRITLEVTNIRIQRLQDISEEEAIAEGIEFKMFDVPFYKNYLPKKEDCFSDALWRYHNPIHSFQSLWISINGRDSWVNNPWCWVVEFQKYEHS